MQFHCLIVSIRSQPFFICFSFCMKYVFCLWRLSLYLVLISLTIIFQGVVCLIFILLDIYWASYICELILLTKFGKFGPLYPQIFFSTPFLLSPSPLLSLWLQRYVTSWYCLTNWASLRFCPALYQSFFSLFSFYWIWIMQLIIQLILSSS